MVKSLVLLHLTGFYGNPNTALKVESWNLLKSLSRVSQLPWLVIGDFNEITCPMEKERGALRPNHQITRFNNSINYCGLREVGFVGPRFTWLYQKRDRTQIGERLDRALATQDWFFMFPTTKLIHKSSFASDHSPLLLNFLHKPKRKKAKMLFCFEVMRLKDTRCNKVVLDAWSKGLISEVPFLIVSCLELCKLRLDAWNQSEFGHVGKYISQLQK